MLRHEIVELVYVERLAAAIYEARYPVFFRLTLIVVMMLVVVLMMMIMIMMVLVVLPLVVVLIICLL